MDIWLRGSSERLGGMMEKMVLGLFLVRKQCYEIGVHCKANYTLVSAAAVPVIAAAADDDDDDGGGGGGG